MNYSLDDWVTKVKKMLFEFGFGNFGKIHIISIIMHFVTSLNIDR